MEELLKLVDGMNMLNKLSVITTSSNRTQLLYLKTNLGLRRVEEPSRHRNSNETF